MSLAEPAGVEALPGSPPASSPAPPRGGRRPAHAAVAALVGGPYPNLAAPGRLRRAAGRDDQQAVVRRRRSPGRPLLAVGGPYPNLTLAL